MENNIGSISEELTHHGRLNLSAFWLRFFAAQIAIGILDSIPDAAGVLGWITTLLSLALLYISVVLIIKRLHDRGKSGWWTILFFFAPYACVAVILLAEIYSGPIFCSLVTSAVVLGTWGGIEIGFFRGNDGVNKYGPNPITNSDKKLDKGTSETIPISSKLAILATFIGLLLIATLALENVVGILSRYMLNKPFVMWFGWFDLILVICFSILIFCGVVIWYTLRSPKQKQQVSDILKWDLPLIAALSIASLLVLVVSTGSLTFLSNVIIPSGEAGIRPYSVLFAVFTIFGISLFCPSPTLAVWCYIPMVLVFSVTAGNLSIINVMAWIAPSMVLLCVASVLISLAFHHRLTAPTYYLVHGTLLILFFIFILPSGIFTPAELAAVLAFAAAIYTVVLYFSGESNSVICRLVFCIRNIASLLVGILLANIIMFASLYHEVDLTTMNLISENAFSDIEEAVIGVTMVIAVATAALVFLLSPFVVPGIVAVSYAVLIRAGLGPEMFLPAVMMGAMSGLFIMAVVSSTGGHRLELRSSYWALGITAILIGTVAPMLFPLGNAIIQMTEGW